MGMKEIRCTVGISVALCSRLLAKLAIVLGASLTIFKTRTSVRAGFRSFVSTGIFVFLSHITPR
jgi:hypothetical protein